MYINEEQRQTAVLVGVHTGEYDVDVSLDELEELANTAGAEVVAKFVQKMNSINHPNYHSATYVRSGKLEEIKHFCEMQQVDLLIFDDELTGIQLRNIEQITNVRVIDRTMLILDIFAMRASSKEGKLQVELAQQKYLMPRLIGLGAVLSRQAGGIGTRGPGETKLESDRRHIRRRIDKLTQELQELERQRERTRQRRRKNSVITVAIVGYTNVGKSTLLNALTNAGVLEKNQLFATLDPTARELKLPDGQKVVLIDTVGFINRLPHQLVEAFQSTLEEAASADLILNVCDISNPMMEQQLEVTKNILNDLGCAETPMLTVYNKTDLYQWQSMATITNKSVFISAKQNKGIDDLLNAICKQLAEQIRTMDLLIPYTEGALLDKIRRFGKIIQEDYQTEGVCVRANIDIKMLKLVAPYVIESDK